MSFNLSSNDVTSEPPSHFETDRVKWTSAPRLQSNGEHFSNLLIFLDDFSLSLKLVLRSGKSFYNEVSVSMMGVNEERVCASYGLTTITSKSAFGQDLD